MPRFVLLEHDHPYLHWDFMLEAGDLLVTWRLSAPPLPQQTVFGERIDDHRLAYLDYEGPISGGRGSVTRWDGGDFAWIEDGMERKEVRLNGSRLQGTLLLECTQERKWRCTLT